MGLCFNTFNAGENYVDAGILVSGFWEMEDHMYILWDICIF
jgi:hypothetical protein